MATFNKFQQLVEDLALGVHNLNAVGGHTLKVLLSIDAPDAAADAVRANLTSELGTANGYTAGGAPATITSSDQIGGTYKLVLGDVTFTASGGSIGPFRYVVLYNDTPTSPADPLIGYYDYGTNITITSSNSFTVDFDATNGVLTLA